MRSPICSENDIVRYQILIFDNSTGVGETVRNTKDSLQEAIDWVLHKPMFAFEATISQVLDNSSASPARVMRISKHAGECDRRVVLENLFIV